MIQDVTIKNFMAHNALTCTDLPAINLLLGKNDTGKTGLLKMLYGVTKSLETFSIKSETVRESFKKVLAAKLDTTFMPRRGLGDLVQKSQSERLHIALKINGGKDYLQQINFQFGESTQNTITDGTEQIDPLPPGVLNALFIPAKEVLTAFRDIRIIREQEYGRGFDDTYLDLIRALDIPTTKGRISTELSGVSRMLEDLFEGSIEQTHDSKDPFVFKKGKQQFAMHQTAEGVKKIGILTTLIRNRQIRKGTVLFMDEPETALHPTAIRDMVKMIVAMSKAGVQIFLATHSYFIIKQLAISTREEAASVLCWNLKRAPGEPVQIDFEIICNGTLPQNEIIDEALAMYNEDVKAELGI